MRQVAGKEREIETQRQEFNAQLAKAEERYTAQVEGLKTKHEQELTKKHVVIGDVRMVGSWTAELVV